MFPWQRPKPNKRYVIYIYFVRAKFELNIGKEFLNNTQMNSNDSQPTKLCSAILTDSESFQRIVY